MKINPTPVDQVDLLGYMGDHRGGARAVSPTEPYHNSLEPEDHAQRPRDMIEEDQPRAVMENAEQEVHEDGQVNGEDGHMDEGMENEETYPNDELLDNGEGEEAQNHGHDHGLRNVLDRRDHVVARAAAHGRLHHDGDVDTSEHHAVAWVGGGLATVAVQPYSEIPHAGSS